MFNVLPDKVSDDLEISKLTETNIAHITRVAPRKWVESRNKASETRVGVSLLRCSQGHPGGFTSVNGGVFRHGYLLFGSVASAQIGCLADILARVHRMLGVGGHHASLKNGTDDGSGRDWHVASD